MNELPFRQIHMDFHTSPFIPDVGASFDAQEFAQTLLSARVNSINLFAKCHHGMYYFPTKLGTVHPSLNFDLLGAQIKACREAGIRACVYTTAAWNEDFADRHPEWMQVSMDGVLGIKKPFTIDNHGWRFLCQNNRAHVNYLKEELTEIYGLYKPEGFWIDIVVQAMCICHSCTRDMGKLGMNVQNKADVGRHGRMVVISFMREIYAYLKEMDNDIGVYFNGGIGDIDIGDDEALSTKQMRLHNSYIDIESLPSDQWGYTHYPINVNHSNKYNQEITMMNGKFHKAWGDFGSLRNTQALEYECFRALASGAKICIGDQLHPSGKIDNTVYKRIGEVLSDVEKKEKYCRNTKKISQIGVFVPYKTLRTWEASAGATAEGVYRMMSELHYMFDFVDFGDDISRYDLVILPDDIRLPEHIAKKINDYVRKNGKLVITGNAGLDITEDRFVIDEMGAVYKGPADYNPRYIHITEDSFPHLQPMDYVMYMAGVKTEAKAGAEVIAYINNSYFNRSYDRFCSHRHTPPAGVTTEPSIVRNNNVIYISNPLFRDYAHNGCMIHRDIVKDCIERLLPRPIVTCDLPAAAEVSIRHQDNRRILHILYYLIQRKSRTMDIIEEKPSLYDREVSICLPAKPRKVYTAPVKEDLNFTYDGEYVRFVIPEISGHQMVVIED